MTTTGLSSRQQEILELIDALIGRAHVWNSSHKPITYAGYCKKQKKY